MTLKADDGTPLEAKEGVLLDQNGNPIHVTREAREVKSSKMPVWALPIAFVMPFIIFGLIAFFGMSLLAVLFFFWIAFGFIRWLLHPTKSYRN